MTPPPSPQGLLPCPFCGDSASPNNVACEGYVYCVNPACHATIRKAHRTHDDEGMDKAIAAWNHRAPAPAQDDVREELACLIDYIIKCDHRLTDDTADAILAKFHVAPKDTP